MAGVEHLLLLRQGVEIWNQWRKKNPTVKPYLREAVLRPWTSAARTCVRLILERPICPDRSWWARISGVLTCLAPVLSAPI